MDWYLIYKITILPLKKLEGNEKLEGIMVICLQFSLPPLIRHMLGGIKYGGPKWMPPPSSSPLLPLIPPTKQRI